MKNFLIWDYSDIKDPFKRSEVQANKIAAVTMFNCAIFFIIACILTACGVFTLGTKNMPQIIVEVVLELLIPSLICFIFKGRTRWLRYFLLIAFAVIACRLYSFLQMNVICVIFIPCVLSARYYDRKFSMLICALVILLFVIFACLSPFCAVKPDLALLSLEEVQKYYANPSGYVIQAGPYIKRILVDRALPVLFVLIVVCIVCVDSAGRGRALAFEHKEMSESHARIDGELTLATEIQSSMLPKIFPAFPSNDNFDIYATMKPAKEVGGDFYDFFLLDENHVAIVIADVSGKGIPAALFMAIAKTLIKNTLYENDVEDTLSKVNNSLCEGNDIGLFVTAWIGVMDLVTGKLTYANAGHNNPVVKTNNEFKYLTCAPGFVLAGLPNFNYRSSSIYLKPGDEIFLYTDGVTEDTDINNELFGENRLLDYLNEHKNLTIKDQLDNLNEELKVFAKGREQFDDITMLALTYIKSSNSLYYKKEFEGSISSLPQVNEFLESNLESMEASMKIINSFNICIEELFTNVVKYGYKDEPGKIYIDITKLNDVFTIRIIDNSHEFNPLLHTDPDITQSADDRPIGGLGIFMVKKMMDEVSYVYKNRQNIVILSKKN